MYNPYSGVAIGWDFPAHVANGYQGGVDFKLPANSPVYAVASGTLVGNTLIVSATVRVQYLEVARFTAKGRVKQGQIIGYTSKKWLHIHAYKGTKRVDFRTLLPSAVKSRRGYSSSWDMKPRWGVQTVYMDGHKTWTTINSPALANAQAAKIGRFTRLRATAFKKKSKER